jgi:O-antigen biosynthesis protein WbqP
LSLHNSIFRSKPCEDSKRVSTNARTGEDFKRLPSCAEIAGDAIGAGQTQTGEKLDCKPKLASFVKRLFDVSLGVFLLPIVSLPMVAIALSVWLTSRGPMLYCSDRIGRNNKVFRMPKFRTMYIDTPEVATHLLGNAPSHITPVGSLLRKTSLDELPQIFSILRGDLSFVGPRPALHNQYDLVLLRTECGVHKILPGLTGWAQVNGRDDLPIPLKVKYDYEYSQRSSLLFDIEIIFRTLVRVTRRDGVTH